MFKDACGTMSSLFDRLTAVLPLVGFLLLIQSKERTLKLQPYWSTIPGNR